jgi:hypothetical protein
MRHRKRPQCGTHKVSTLMHKQRREKRMHMHIHTGRGQKMHRCIHRWLLELMHLCAPNIQLIVQILTGYIINSDLHFAAGVARRDEKRCIMQLICHCAFGVAAQHALLQSLLSFFAQRRVFRCWCWGRGNIIRTRVFRSGIYCTTWKVALGWLMAGRLPACWHALAKV